MKHCASLAVLIVMLAGTALPGSALSKSMHSSMMASAPKCATGDAIVGVNMMSKTYMTHAQMKAAAKGMTDAQVHSMMSKNHMKMMCQSTATHMGAKMSKPKM